MRLYLTECSSVGSEHWFWVPGVRRFKSCHSDMKICTACKEEKELNDFSWRNKLKGLKNSWCKSCLNKYNKRKWKESSHRRSSNMKANYIRKKRNSQFVWNYLEKHSCVDCGESNPVVLEFDHRDVSTKVSTISDMIAGSYSIERIKFEIEKCDVRCANCHRIRTSKQLEWYKNIYPKEQ